MVESFNFLIKAYSLVKGLKSARVVATATMLCAASVTAWGFDADDVAPKDYVAIQNLIGAYQWLMDEGDGDGWAALFAEDGVLAGATNQPITGREKLKAIPAVVIETWGGGLRHMAGSVWIHYGENENSAVAKFYNEVTTWNGPRPEFFTMALSEMELIRVNGKWKITLVNLTNLKPVENRLEE